VRLKVIANVATATTIAASEKSIKFQIGENKKGIYAVLRRKMASLLIKTH
jgi:hypothetical protein